MVKHFEVKRLMAAALALFILAGWSEAATLVVGQNCEYQSIQAAVDAALPGDEIEIQSGTYYEHLNLTKPLRLIGIDSGQGRPVVDAGGQGSPIALKSDGTTVDGLIIKGSGAKEPGIAVLSSGNTISNNEICHQGKDGLLLQRSSNNLIAGNLLAYNGRNGIYLQQCNNNILSDNTASYNSNAGIVLEESSSNRLERNAASKNKDGILLDRSGNNLLQQNLLMSNSRDGIALQESHANRLIKNNASYDYNGVRLTNSAENRLQENFAGFCHQNGIRLVSSSGNVLWQNVLQSNGRDAYDDENDNLWYDSEQRAGNYYSELMNCSDGNGDGFCDEPYSIAGGRGIDLYPQAAIRPQGLLFIEMWTREEGTLEEGTTGRMMIDFPMYRVDGPNLRPVHALDLPADTLALAGSGLCLAGDLGGGATSSLYPVTELPYRLENATILNLQGDSATIAFKGQQKTLVPGESWQEESEEIRVVGDARMKVVVTTTITNHGRMALVQSGTA